LPGDVTEPKVQTNPAGPNLSEHAARDLKVNGVWHYVYRAVDQYAQVIDVLVSIRRDAQVARRFFRRALAH